MSVLDLLRGKNRQISREAGDTETVRKIVRELDALPAAEARYVAAFAFILARVANADLDISAVETRRMERLLIEHAGLPEEQAILAVQIAKAQSRLFGGTENFLVTREFKQIASREQCLTLLDCLFAVAAADDSISSGEENEIRQIASELALTLSDLDGVRSRYSAQREVLKGLPRPAPAAPTE
ncbi:MAG TPA: TerB family tellurite resistance protein [Thermoanaerobaculia bacterium]|nr:TerB family tellurite resistance protein [Thermoanaerobaculia bacterium]